MIPFKVMTFNLRGSYFEIDGDNFWNYRADLNVRTLHKYAPDLISFQEFQFGNLETYHHTLTDYDYELGMVTIDQSDFGMFNAIYWKKERFLPLDRGGFYLSPTPDEWSIGWDSSLIRATNWIKFRDLWTYEEFLYANTHLDHLGETSRVEGSKLNVERLNQIANGLPIIITGDFNSRAWSPPDEDQSNLPAGITLNDIPPSNTAHKVYSDAGFVDTYLQAGHQENINTNTYHNFIGEQYPPMAVRIDWILTRNSTSKKFITYACEILRDGEPPVYPSDHYPVLADLELK